jgi:hypothetical protein
MTKAPAPEANYKVSSDSVSSAEIDACLEEFSAAHPGVQIKVEQRVWLVTFDADQQPTGTVISAAYDFPDPYPAEETPEYITYAETMKQAMESLCDLASLTDAERQYFVFGFFFDYIAGNEVFTVTTSTYTAHNKTAKPLPSAEIQPLRDAAKDEARRQNKLRGDPKAQQMEKILAELRQANPGAEETHRVALYSVTFDGKREWTGAIISKHWDVGKPRPATATETVNDFAGLLVAQRQYVVFGEQCTVRIGEKATDICITQRIHLEPGAKPLSDAEKDRMTEDANGAIYQTIGRSIEREASGEPIVMRVKDMRRDNPEMAAGLPAGASDDDTVAVKLKPLSARHPKGWKPKGWTKLKEKGFQQWLADGKPGLEQGGEPLPDDPNLCSRDDELREMFDDVMKACEKQERMEREIAELVRRSGGVA